MLSLSVTISYEKQLILFYILFYETDVKHKQFWKFSNNFDRKFKRGAHIVACIQAHVVTSVKCLENFL